VRTDGRKKASHDISPVHSVHLADIKTRFFPALAVSAVYFSARRRQRRQWPETATTMTERRPAELMLLLLLHGTTTAVPMSGGGGRATRSTSGSTLEGDLRRSPLSLTAAKTQTARHGSSTRTDFMTPGE